MHTYRPARDEKDNIIEPPLWEVVFETGTRMLLIKAYREEWNAAALASVLNGGKWDSELRTLLECAHKRRWVYDEATFTGRWADEDAC